MGYTLLIFLMLMGCQNASYEDFRAKGRAKTRSLLSELKAVRTRDQLIEHEARLQEAFTQLIILAEQVQKFQEQHPLQMLLPMTDQDHELSDQLRLEILRIQRLDGGRDVLNKCRQKRS